MDDKSRFLELLAKKKLNNATLTDIAELNLLCKQYEIDLNSFNDSEALLKIKFSPKNLPSQQQTQKSWENFKTKVALIDVEAEETVQVRQLKTKKPSVIYAVAATLIISLGMGFLFFNNNFSQADNLNIVSTQNGSKSKIQLPDGTQVWLNSGSEITYNDQFGLKTRTVTLVGEAYFDVKHDVKHPFIIHTKNLNLKVLGTAFNVRAYANEALSEATLIRGSLEVSFPNRDNGKLVLKPKEKVSYNDTEGTRFSAQASTIEAKPMITISKVDYSPKEKVIEEVAWKEDKLIFRSKELADLVLDLQRWYDIKITIANDSLKDKKFTGIFKNENVFEALDALKQTYPFSYSYNKSTNSIIINQTN